MQVYVAVDLQFQLNCLLYLHKFLAFVYQQEVHIVLWVKHHTGLGMPKYSKAA